MLRRWSASFLLAGAACTASSGLPAADGGVSPPGADAAVIADAGAPDAAVRYHPLDYLSPVVHGLALKTGAEDCRRCHGADLTGGTAPQGPAPSCDGCHAAGWRTNCTFCHGGAETPSGAPPRDLRGATVREELSFRAHTPHVSLGNHAAFDCTECHLKPTDVLSMSHVFDDTPGAAEVTFENGLSRGGLYEGGGSCTNLYCHGNGRMPGAYQHERATPTCDGCHAGPTSSAARLALLSGQHHEHLRHNVACHECHSRTLDALQTILNPDVHVNGMIDVDFASGQITRANGSCNGSCHQERHIDRTWQ